jgi:glucokinase
MKNTVTGIDVGGTHITVCLVDVENGRMIRESHSRAHVDTSLDKDAIISCWSEAIIQSHAKTGIRLDKIGIAMPGPFDYENGISYITGLHKYESLYGLNVKDLLAEKLGIIPENIKLINDASAYLLGEMSAGAAKGYSNIVGITLGTGLGSAVYLNNTLHEGDLYCTDFEDAKCEDFASARWLINEYEKSTGKRVSNVKEIADRCQNEATAKEVFQKFGRNLFGVLFKRYNHQSPDLVVVGGNISKAWDQFIPSAIQSMEQAGFHFKLKPAELGEEAALIGAAYLWKS